MAVGRREKTTQTRGKNSAWATAEALLLQPVCVPLNMKVKNKLNLIVNTSKAGKSKNAATVSKTFAKFAQQNTL